MNENRTTSHFLKVKYFNKYFGFAFLITITFKYDRHFSITFHELTSYNLDSVHGTYMYM